MTQQQTHSAGAVRAANKLFPDFEVVDEISKIIDRETHAAEMIAFIEKVAAWEFGSNSFNPTALLQVQAEAFILLKKARG